jgi:hypothetical protein
VAKLSAFQVPPRETTALGQQLFAGGMRRTMEKPLRYAVLLVSVLLGVAFLVFLINQTVQVVGLADRLHPALGTTVLWGLLLIYGACAFVPLAVLLRLPQPLTPPASEASPEFPAHLEALSRRLHGNPLLGNRSLASRGEVEEALKVLDARADEIVRSVGSQVFITTAVSQNGSLDGLMVLLAQSKMLWQIARVYYQRPTIRDLATLYGNVASTVFIASQLDDLDLAEQVQPLVSGVLGSAAGAVPGLHAASTLFVNSVVNGTANAFLTLRVGIIAKRYCGALVLPEPRAVRRLAVSQAAQMLGAIAQDGAKRVAGAFWAASKTRVGEAARGMTATVRSAVTTLIERLGCAASEPSRPADAPPKTGAERGT